MAEQEPGGWELLRAIKGIETRLDQIQAGMVPSGLFIALQERVKEQAQEIAQERRDRQEDIASVRREIEDQRKQRAQMWTAIAVAGIAAVVALANPIIQAGLGLP